MKLGLKAQLNKRNMKTPENMKKLNSDDAATNYGLIVLSSFHQIWSALEVGLRRYTVQFH